MHMSDLGGLVVTLHGSWITHLSCQPLIENIFMRFRSKIASDFITNQFPVSCDKTEKPRSKQRRDTQSDCGQWLRDTLMMQKWLLSEVGGILTLKEEQKNNVTEDISLATTLKYIHHI